MSKILRTFPKEAIPEEITYAKGMNIYTSTGNTYWDMTGGFTAHAVLGWNNKRINNAINSQLNKVAHIDYKTFTDANREELAEIMIGNSSHNLDRLFLCGGSGGEACEAAMHLSYQIHYEMGKRNKHWFISRTQSYHGATTECISIGERPNLEFYRPLCPPKRAKITEHNKYRHKKENETDEEYGLRSARELEEKILEIGAENVCGFIAETMLGGLVGDVPPTKNYWKEIRRICDKYDVHLLVDEVWCGCGVSGKNFCIDWDQITPDFIFFGKTFAAGYMPISGLVTSSRFEEVIKNGSGRIENSTTFQGHSAAVAATLECQRIINESNFLKNVTINGQYFRDLLFAELKDEPFFKNVRGRGMRNSLEYSCHNQHLFGTAITAKMKADHNILISGKWHRLTFSNSMMITKEEIEKFVAILTSVFREISKNWTHQYANNVTAPNLF